MEKKVYWLQYKESCIAYLSFEEIQHNMIQVKGPLGAASYIDEKMSREEARLYWKNRVADGYRVISPDQAPNSSVHNALTYGR